METLQQPVLNLAAALDAMGDDREIYDEVLGVYLQSTPALIEELETGMRTGDRAVVKRCAHSIKSSSLAIGAVRLGVAAETLERITPAATFPEIGHHLGGIKTIYADLTTALAGAGLLKG